MSCRASVVHIQLLTKPSARSRHAAAALEGGNGRASTARSSTSVLATNSITPSAIFSFLDEARAKSQSRSKPHFTKGSLSLPFPGNRICGISAALWPVQIAGFARGRWAEIVDGLDWKAMADVRRQRFSPVPCDIAGRRAGGAAVGDERDVAAPRAGRRGRLDRRQGGSGSCPLVDYRYLARRPPADGERRRLGVDQLQWRDLQFSRDSATARSAGLPVSQPQRHRSHRQWLARL